MIVIPTQRWELVKTRTPAVERIESGPQKVLVVGEDNYVGLLGELTQHFEGCRGAVVAQHDQTIVDNEWQSLVAIH